MVLMEEEKYYCFQDILKFIGMDCEFERKKPFPFNRNKENVVFCWGQILIPRYGIFKTVQNKISDIKEIPIHEIKMMYQIPFYEVKSNSCGLVNKDISLTFRYDKEYKYGEITKSIYECCFWILQNAEKTNDFYIIKDDNVQRFFSSCIIPNQWGLGSLEICSSCNEKMN